MVFSSVLVVIMKTVISEWSDDMSFCSTLDGHRLVMDAESSFGGKDRGPRPKMLLLSSLGGCTGMDVISILKKMRVNPDTFRIIAEAEIAEEHPKVFTKIHLIYEFKGANLPPEKLKKAVDLSQERYCPVSAMLRKACSLTYEIKVNGN
jgi:putative redox protein